MRLKAEHTQKLKGIIVQFGFTIAGLLILIQATAAWQTREHWMVLFTYTLLTLIFSFAPMRTLNSTITLNNAVIFTGILLYGAWVGVWTALIETLIIAFLVRFHLIKALANTGQLLLTIWLVDFMQRVLIEYHVNSMISDMILAVVYWLVNIVLCAIGISYYFKLAWFSTVKNLAKGTTLIYLILMLTGAIAVRLVEGYGLLALLPIIAVIAAFNGVVRQYFKGLDNLKAKVDEIKALNRSFLTAMAASIDAKDQYTSGHSQRVAHWAKEIAVLLELPPEKIEEVYFGGILHDIGKIGIEDEILNKDGKLTPEEFNRIKQHTVIGYEILKQAGVFQNLLPAIRSHHERIDGRGYPDRLRGENIPLMARILAISDAFDAMVSNRPYREGVPVAEALCRIEEGYGSQFDEEIAKLFVKYIRELPPEKLKAYIRQGEQTEKEEFLEKALS
ncbi:HD-GYP domain-containing protein [Brevibacillus fulvus]|uniref:Nucleotidyltransferase with HDIG domain n=1 Tax=Brevibacillus fulvus TaxID=1125967 RepID=A0A938Y578_9BACL|nr:HD-GYP domain-containing protein [Brevibacillus fulvus]MBM7591460.1 putative nucleotidyltransferase with HDIG domain [Brevibacillus fulvus]